MDSFLLEIAAYSAESAIRAARSGANRIELCDNPYEGGTTPSYGVLKLVREHINIPVFPIIRPRGGHFVFTEAEITSMRYDILLCKEMGFEGVVIGLLNEDGTVDYENTAMLVELAYPLEVTFHRAFDRTPDPFLAMENIINAGCTRILTSGQAPDVNIATALVSNLIRAADYRIGIMPGAGVRAKNIISLAAATGATEFHSSASYWENDPYFSPETMKETMLQNKVNESEIKEMLLALQPPFKFA